MTFLEYLTRLFPDGKDALDIARNRCPSNKDGRGRECDRNCSQCWLSEMPENAD